MLGNNIKRTTQAGGRPDESQVATFVILSEIKIITYIMYGQTEATARITCFDLTKNPEKINSVKLLAGSRLK